MVRNIFLGVLLVYGVAMTVFANLKANEAEKLQRLAKQQEQAALEQSARAAKAEAEAILVQRDAKRQRDLTVVAQMEAEKQREQARKALADCR